jgi:hypothetical protein
MAFWRSCSDEDRKLLQKAWESIGDAAISDNSLIDFFMCIPDKLGDTPLLAPVDLNWKIDVDEQKRRYRSLKKNVDKLYENFIPKERIIDPLELEKERIIRDKKKENESLEQKIKREKKEEALNDFLKRYRQTRGDKPSPFLQILKSDARATGSDAVKMYDDFERIRKEFALGLVKFSALLDIVDPRMKSPTKQRKTTDDSDKHNYIQYIAKLNCYLKDAKHTSLAIIANVNNPDYAIKKDSIEKAWSRMADKKPY